MNKLDDRYFYTFKLNILSGRQTPEALGSLFKSVIFAQLVLGGMTIFLAPLVILNQQVISTGIAFFIVNLILTVIASFKWMYKKCPKIQYGIFNVNIGFFSLYCILLGCETFFSGTDSISTYDKYRLPVVVIANLLNVIVLVVSFYIFRNQIIRGKYQEKSESSKKMIKNDRWVKALTPVLVVSSLLIPFIVKQLIPSNGLMFGFMGVFFIFLGCMTSVGVSWTFMTFYCKLRFISFNPAILEGKNDVV